MINHHSQISSYLKKTGWKSKKLQTVVILDHFKKNCALQFIKEKQSNSN